MTTENLNFELALSGTYWENKPQYQVFLNDAIVADSVVEAASDETFVVAFNADLEEEKEHKISIRLHGKTDYDTVENADKTGILKDLLLNIVELKLDGISVGTLLHTNSKYYMDDGKTDINCVNLGRNGDWVFKFSSPFYIWLLENM